MKGPSRPGRQRGKPADQARCLSASLPTFASGRRIAPSVRNETAPSSKRTPPTGSVGLPTVQASATPDRKAGACRKPAIPTPRRHRWFGSAAAARPSARPPAPGIRGSAGPTAENSSRRRAASRNRRDCCAPRPAMRKPLCQNLPPPWNAARFASTTRPAPCRAR